MTTAAPPVEGSFVSERADPRRLQRLAPLVAAALAFGVAMRLATPYAVGIFHDDGLYVILAKSIATGQGYRYLHLPGAPAAAHYPPGYPLFLAALWRLVPEFPANLTLFLFANALFLASIAWSTTRFARRVLGWDTLQASLAGAVATLSLPLMMLSRLVLSEPMFVALLIPILAAAESLASDRESTATWRPFLIGMAAGMLTLVRTHGAALDLALLLVLALQRRWADVWRCFAGAAIAVLPWEVWQVAHPATLPQILSGSYGSYAAWLADGLHGGVRFVTRTMIVNAREIGETLADRFALSDYVRPREVATLLAAGATVFGWARALRRAPVTGVFALIYVGVILVWPFTPWRFLFALWPLVVLALGEAMRWTAEQAERRDWRALAGVPVMASLVVGAVRSEVRAYADDMLRGSAASATQQAAPVVRWIAANTSPTDVVGADAEPLVYLFTGRRSVPLEPFTAAEYLRPRSMAQNATSLRGLIASIPVTWVVTVAPDLYQSARQIVALPTGPRLESVATLPNGGAFRVERP